MADSKKPRTPAASEAAPAGAGTGKKDHDGGRRAFFRSIFSPLTAIAGVKPVVENPGVYFTKNPPSQKMVIRGGSNAEVMALLGPLGRGELAPGGYRLLRVAIGPDRIDIIFELVFGETREEMHNIAVALLALDSTEGITWQTTTSFRLVATGDAPPEHMGALCARLASEIENADQGHLWVTAASTTAATAGGGRGGGGAGGSGR